MHEGHDLTLEPPVWAILQVPNQFLACLGPSMIYCSDTFYSSERLPHPHQYSAHKSFCFAQQTVLCHMQLVLGLQQSTVTCISYCRYYPESWNHVICICMPSVQPEIISWQACIAQLSSPPSSSTNFDGGLDCDFEPAPMFPAYWPYCRCRILDQLAFVICLPGLRIRMTCRSAVWSAPLPCKDDQVIDDKWSSQLFLLIFCLRVAVLLDET